MNPRDTDVFKKEPDILVNDAMLEEIANWIVHSEYTATENTKSDSLVEEPGIDLENWVLELVWAMIYSDEQYLVYKGSELKLTYALIDNEKAKKILQDEYESIKDCLLDDLY